MLAQEKTDCILACERLCHDFGWQLDHRNYPAFLEIFAEDGVFDRGAAGFHNGQGELMEFLEARPLDVVTRHLFIGVRITPESSDFATGTSSCFVYRMTAAPDQKYPLPMPALRLVEFDDEYVKTALGWRFKSRRTSQIFN